MRAGHEPRESTDRTGPAGAASVAATVEALTERGYTGDFRAGPGPSLREVRSGASFSVESLRVDSLHRFEGVSDPDDQAIVFALRSPDDRIRGTYVVTYGPAMGPDDAEVVRRLGDPDPGRSKGGSRQ
jgi:hypothetical protein